MSSAPPLETPLHAWHRAHGGRMVEFGGWSMPVQYTTIAAEHQAVRERAGLFDISHMGRLMIDGPAALDWLERVTTNHVARLRENQIQYSLIANGGGGLIDDVLVYRLTHAHALICNASNRERVVEHLFRHGPGADALMADRTSDTSMIALQGPEALAILQPLTDATLASLKYYHLTMGWLLGDVTAVISRTGYTGEDGFELILPSLQAEHVWEALLESGRACGVVPCGLGARDTLRFEAAMPLYGHELTETTNPYAAGVGWAVKLDKGDFIGREALRAFKAHPGQTRVGLRLEGKRIARQGSVVHHDGKPAGVVTSGTFSPTLGQSLALALVDPAIAALGTRLNLDVRGHDEPAEVVALPFYRRTER